MRHRMTFEISTLTVISFKQKELPCNRANRSKEMHKVRTTWYNKTSF